MTQLHGAVGLPPAGLAEPGSIDGALDCDIGLCPVTNTMPIRRLRLLKGNVPLTVDSEGVVIDYPGLATRLAEG